MKTAIDSLKKTVKKYRHAWVLLYGFIYFPWFTYLERHNETDELFVLLEGECTLYVADGVGDALGQISTVVMEKRKMYNIKKGVWHNLAGNEQMVLLIVENADTSKGNSDFFPVTADMLP